MTVLSLNAKREQEAAKALADKYIQPDGSKPTVEEFREAVTVAAAKPRDEYELERVALAERFGVRRDALDTMVEDVRVDTEVGSLLPTFMQAETPWAEPVVGTELLDEIYGTIRRHISMTQHSALACSLWALFAHTHDAFQISPLLLIHSPEPMCGKSTLLEVIGGIVPKPLTMVAASPAAVYRLTDEASPTLLFDEGDAQSKQGLRDLRAIMNGGHKRSTASVPRAVPGGHGTKFYSLWAPKALARIGTEGVHATQISRAIQIAMYRRNESERAANEKIPLDLRERLTPLRQRCVRWAQDNIEALKIATPDLPSVLEDREQDNWQSLIAIADLCGAGGEARAVALKLSTSHKSETKGLGPLLLSDLRDLFDETGAIEIATTDILTLLLAREDRAWASLLHETSRASALAQILKVYSVRPDSNETIEPRKLTIGSRPMGYRLEQFVFAWERYVAPRSVEARQHSTDSTDVGAVQSCPVKKRRSAMKARQHSTASTSRRAK